MTSILHFLHLTPYSVVSILLCALIFLICLSMIPQKTAQRSSKPTPSHQNDFDYLSRYESIPSHYDLALAYMASGQTNKGLYKLSQVAASNHPIYAGKAQEKLDEINQKK